MNSRVNIIHPPAVTGGPRPVLVPASWCSDDRLSLRARGLLLTVAGYSAGGQQTALGDWLGQSTTSNADEIREALTELERLGYLADEDGAPVTASAAVPE